MLVHLCKLWMEVILLTVAFAKIMKGARACGLGFLHTGSQAQRSFGVLALFMGFGLALNALDRL